MKFGLLGHQIAYSLSPVIHELIRPGRMAYEILDLPPEELKTAKTGRLSEMNGFNVTIPYKQEVMAFCDAMDPNALKIGAVNTVDIRNGMWKGYNTDFLGFLRTVREDIPNYLSYHPVMIGYGGVARAVLHALEILGFLAVTVQGGALQEERETFISQVRNTDLRMKIIDQVPRIPVMWINCTPVGGAKMPDVPENYITPSSGDVLFDLNYVPSPTHLERYAAARKVKTVNGLKMLVYQAVEAQKIWFPEEVFDDVDVMSIMHSLENLHNVS